MKTIRWGIIGVGDVTEVKSGPGFYKADHSALVAVMRRNGALAADYARRHNVPRWYDDADALIHDPEVDAVYIATPPSTHKEYVLKVAAAGKPVYVEKPMGMNYAECLEMIDACEQAGVPLWVAFYRRALPNFLKVKQLIDEGAIGTVRFVDIVLTRKDTHTYGPGNLPWRVNPQIAGAGHFADLASHTLDYLDYFIGPIVEARGHAGNQAGRYPAEDTVSGSFVFENGVQGSGIWCFDSYTNEDKTQIVGTKGMLTFSTLGMGPIALTTEAGTTEFDIPIPAHVQQPLIQTIVNELNGIGQCPSTGRSGSRANWVMDQLLADYYRKPVPEQGS
jgi:predicted dehydrogenase